jgi:hypothetical protein
MRTLVATMAVVATLATPGPVRGQIFRKPDPPPNPIPDSTAATPKTDRQVFPSASVLPEPVKPDQIEPPTIALPDEPIEPYLLTKDAGPFMVCAFTFRGPEAAKYAQVLCMELRRDYHLPAWIFYKRIQPGGSNIREVPPTAIEQVKAGQVTPPAKYRIYDEAAVLVGNCKTLKESVELLHQVKKLHPKCLEQMPVLLPWRRHEGLKRALRTTNPYVPAQYLFPKHADPLIKQMNSGPEARHSIYHCPGRYTLQVAEFLGRTTYAQEEIRRHRLQGDKDLSKSPLATAADDAERLADALAEVPEIKRLGYKPYVYHDRFSSKVTVGAFNPPPRPDDDPQNPQPRPTTDDPAAEQLRQTLLKIAFKLANEKNDTMIVPASVLMPVPPH